MLNICTRALVRRIQFKLDTPALLQRWAAVSAKKFKRNGRAPTFLAVYAIKSVVGVLVVHVSQAFLIRLRRTQISQPLIVFWSPKISSFAPFGAGIQEHRTNLKTCPSFYREKLYSSTFSTRPSATFRQKVTEAITFCDKSSTCKENKASSLKFLTRRGVFHSFSEVVNCQASYSLCQL
jgi:hypothetical protein